MDRKKELRKQIAGLMAEINAIEDTEREEANRPLVGKFYKFRNSYGGSKKWWLYKRITGLSDGEPIGYEFENDSEGRLVVDKTLGRILYGGEIEISATEFNAAWQRFLEAIAAVRED